MVGRVQCFVPAVRRGLLRAESGQEYSFGVPPELGDLQGGDVVEFELADDGMPFVSRVRLRHRWADVLRVEYRPLIDQFHQLVQFQK